MPLRAVKLLKKNTITGHRRTHMHFNLSNSWVSRCSEDLPRPCFRSHPSPLPRASLSLHWVMVAKPKEWHSGLSQAPWNMSQRGRQAKTWALGVGRGSAGATTHLADMHCACTVGQALCEAPGDGAQEGTATKPAAHGKTGPQAQLHSERSYRLDPGSPPPARPSHCLFLVGGVKLNLALPILRVPPSSSRR